jgi:hypothetical protein
MYSVWVWTGERLLTTEELTLGRIAGQQPRVKTSRHSLVGYWLLREPVLPYRVNLCSVPYSTTAQNAQRARGTYLLP